MEPTTNSFDTIQTNKKPSLLILGLKYGGIASAILLVCLFTIFFTKVTGFISFILWLIPLIGFHYLVSKANNEVKRSNNGLISFSDAFLVGFIALIPFMIAMTIYYYTHISSIDMTEISKEVIQQWKSSKMSKAQINEAKSWLTVNTFVAMATLIMFIGGLFAILIQAIATRKTEALDSF